MKVSQKVLGSFVLVGALGISGAAFADININIDFDTNYRPIAKVQTQKQRPPKDFEGKRPPELSRDIKGNPPEPPKGHKPPTSGDRRFDGKKDNKKMPPRPHSDDRRPDRKPDKKPDKKY